jgi:hypothetical protein
LATLKGIMLVPGGHIEWYKLPPEQNDGMRHCSHINVMDPQQLVIV